MKQVLISGGGVHVEDVPAPGCDPAGILVRVAHSCLSVGTEASSVAAVRSTALPTGTPTAGAR